jgi:hypothetical protein
MLHLILLFPLIQFITYNKKSPVRISKTKEFLLCLLFIGINWLMISSTHFFYNEFMLLKNYHFESESLQKLQALLGNLPVPFPEPYVSSFGCSYLL